MAPSRGEPAAATPDITGIATGAVVLVVVTGVLAVVVPDPVVLVVGVVEDVLVVEVVLPVLVVGVVDEVLDDVDEVLVVVELPPPPQAPKSADTSSAPAQVT